MRKILSLILLSASLLFVRAIAAQDAAKADTAATGALSGRWIVNADFFGSPLYFGLQLEQHGENLTGNFAGDKLEGSAADGHIHFLAKDEHGGTEEGSATVVGGTITGSVIFTDSSDPAHPEKHSFTATRVATRREGAAKRHDFVPTTFYRRFSAENKPVLTIAPGDTIHTTTVDAGGTDEKGVARVLGGNPETGPFYIETAAPGDTLAVHITRLRLNRDYAISDDGIVGRALDSDWAVKMKDGFKNVRWHLDLANGTASPEKPAEHLTHYSVPVRPMLGCVAVAPGSTQAAPGTGDSGRYGGNMDFNEIIEGATVYLSVNVPGALLYFGDGHAAQGDGELNGNALETSMDVEVRVDVIPNHHVPGPRVESATHLMAIGLAGSLDDAFREATANMASWLTEEHELTPSEVAQVLGTAAEYKVSEVADRNAGMVLKISKERLKLLATAK
jgi:acetamidase/formamidase